MSYTVNGNSIEVEGILVEIYETQQVTDTFRKREFAIEIPDGQYTNFATFQLTQNNVGLVDSVKKGDRVKVSFNIRGNRYEKNGVVRYITNLAAWRISGIGSSDGPNSSNSVIDVPPMDSSDDSSLPF
jgi:hypothetical protein